jgi:hypothetical protein
LLLEDRACQPSSALGTQFRPWHHALPATLCGSDHAVESRVCASMDLLVVIMFPSYPLSFDQFPLYKKYPY